MQILDRNGKLLQLLPNAKGEFMIPSRSTSRVRELAVLKEDKYFYYHLGINPLSILRGLARLITYGERTGGSTITQQLVKNLLRHENARTVSNKLIELAYAIALELHTGKKEILTMYLSSAYFGNQIEGFENASQYYFGKSGAELTDGEIIRLLALLSSPSFEPDSAGNTARAINLGKRLGVLGIPPYTDVPDGIRKIRKDPAMFEITALFSLPHCDNPCTLSIDGELTAKIREIVNDRLSTKQFDSVKNVAVAVLKLGRNEKPNSLLALVGTLDPYGMSDGSQINMALTPRPIGSTWKPFIYGKAIEKGARPYSKIDDTEYRYEIGTGYAFYPKNYDGVYRGEVTLHYAISNSLNVPAVQALKWSGVDQFGSFMRDSLGFIPLQSFDTYQLSIALGGLEMNPLLLANYFTVFSRNGILAPLELVSGQPVKVPMSTITIEPRRILAGTTTQLINKMLSDRLMGVEQFGLASNLNLPFAEYAVKTGTSYDYHDSWTVGYTPDVVVAVWIGRSDNKPMELLPGARGAGKIWYDVMTLLQARGDIVPQAFDTSAIVPVEVKEGRSFGLRDDNMEHSRVIMKDLSGDEIVLEPHDQDVISYQSGMSIPLRANHALVWKVDGKILGEGKKIFWNPLQPREYTIEAYEKGTLVTTLHIHVIEQS
ncbi:MAG: transglycosylase domain-containing protein, partial [Patescibacteria group bacterium]